jgi:hypothetical protein
MLLLLERAAETAVAVLDRDAYGIGIAPKCRGAGRGQCAGSNQALVDRMSSPVP